MMQPGFRHWIIDDWCRPVAFHRLPAMTPPDAWEVTYDNELERGKVTSRAFDRFSPEVKAIFARLQHPNNAWFWSTVADIDGIESDPMSHGSGLAMMFQKSYLQVHLDFSQHPKLPHKERRLSLIAFIHECWRPKWGGELLLCDPAGYAFAAIEPKPGRLVAFENTDVAFHGVRQLSSIALPRVTASTYLLAPARPEARRLRALYLPNRNTPNCPEEVA